MEMDAMELGKNTVLQNVLMPLFAKSRNKKREPTKTGQLAHSRANPIHLDE
jgi:hypothetical protein